MFVTRISTNTEAGARITAADVKLQFDKNILRASACTAGAGVHDIAGFECRVNMPSLLNSVQLSYVTASGPTENSEVINVVEESAGMDMNSVELALVTFQVAIQSYMYSDLATCYSSNYSR